MHVTLIPTFCNFVALQICFNGKQFSSKAIRHIHPYYVSWIPYQQKFNLASKGIRLNLIKLIETCKDFVPWSPYWCHWDCLCKGKYTGMCGCLAYSVSCCTHFCTHFCGFLLLFSCSQLEGSPIQFSGMLQSPLQTEMVAKDVAGVWQAIGTQSY